MLHALFICEKMIASRNRSGKYYKESCLIIGACCGGLGRYYRKFGCRHITPLLLLVVYTVVGAVMLHFVEAPQEDEREKARLSQLDALRNDTSVKLAAVLNDAIMSDETKLMQTRDWVRWYENQLGLNQQHTNRWDMWGALFYVGTIYTTIGYGNISPSTAAGRLLTVVYAIFGIPLVLAILNDLGQLLRQGINRSWYRLMTLRRRLYRPPSSSKSATGEDEAEEGEEPSPIPISLALSLTVGWVLFCSALFCLWETNWSYGTALYFFFISLSTIGLGDVVPEKPQYMIANFGFVIIGLCLVSMTLGVIQQRIEAFLYRMMKLIRREYEAATAQGDAPRSADGILDKAWQQQAWYVRYLAPRVLSYQAQSRLDRCAVRLVRGETFRTIARDLMVFKNIDSSDMDFKNPITHSPFSCCQLGKYDSLSYSNSNYPHQLSILPQRLLCDTSTQTDRPRPFVDLLTLENDHFTSSYRKYSRQDFLVSMRPSVRDEAVQVCIRVQPAQDSSKKKRSKSTLFSKRKGNTDALAFERQLQFADKVSQTDDSYLKLASKLEALRTNRADSLAIMVTPGAKKPQNDNGKPQNDKPKKQELIV